MELNALSFAKTTPLPLSLWLLLAPPPPLFLHWLSRLPRLISHGLPRSSTSSREGFWPPGLNRSHSLPSLSAPTRAQTAQPLSCRRSLERYPEERKRRQRRQRRRQRAPRRATAHWRRAMALFRKKCTLRSPAWCSINLRRRWVVTRGCPVHRFCVAVFACRWTEGS